MRKFRCISYLEHKTNPTGCGARPASLWVHRNLSGNCQETETCMVRTCHTPRQPFNNHPLGHLGGWATQWSAEEMLDGQHQRVDMSAHARTAYKDLLQDSKKTSAESSLISIPPPPVMTQSVKGLS